MNAQGETGHVDGELAFGDPAVEKVDDSTAAVDDGRTQRRFGDETDRPHGDLPGVAHLFEEAHVVRVVVVGEVDHARCGVPPDPVHGRVAVRNTSGHGLPSLVLFGHWS